MTKAEKDAKALADKAAGIQAGQENKEGDSISPASNDDNKEQGSGLSPVSDTKGKGAKKVEINEELLLEILSKNKDMERRLDLLDSNAVSTQQGGPRILRREQEKFVKMRTWNGDYVLGWENIGKAEKPKFVYIEHDAKTRESIEYINVILKDAKDPIKLKYVEYLRESEPVFVKVLSQDVRESVIEQGMVSKKEFAKNGYGMFETTVLVPVEVITKSSIFTVQLESGETLKIDEKFLG